MMILEEYNAVVTFTESNYGNWKGKLPLNIPLKHVIPLLEKEV
ncbi:hypothetical protein [Fulvivirga maritima]|nr:hypothetical protein [Fulvivirga maritima]